MQKLLFCSYKLIAFLPFSMATWRHTSPLYYFFAFFIFGCTKKSHREINGMRWEKWWENGHFLSSPSRAASQAILLRLPGASLSRFSQRWARNAREWWRSTRDHGKEKHLKSRRFPPSHLPLRANFQRERVVWVNRQPQRERVLAR